MYYNEFCKSSVKETMTKMLVYFSSVLYPHISSLPGWQILHFDCTFLQTVPTFREEEVLSLLANEDTIQIGYD